MIRIVIAGGMIPTAIALIILPAYPDLGNELKNFAFQIAIGAILLFHYLVKTITLRLASNT